ncbi:hypothetical protein TWF192_010920 [Orbilia oligospora]|uniref:DNA mismatch repair protein PMS1 n=1 Tax=Orbilia oligospora TaxID=2813651 RepID=A0A6G1LY37_ORBOL|nr:hypothetical protein TWF679_002616 [Orbilia oligospora]KAF3209154.1 hypothetical protein TWF191_000444 [Orbilia oligospora]KAF3237382.1 hypothetical protein TWF192_010920 [Orbilia oligospora]
MAEIKAIEGRSVHQIQSGQVISDGLCSAVKELVENGIDANATSIEIRFKNHGLDLIEVSDNGLGISPENFDKLALKHYTSKLRSYEDLERVTTYGFRGEALSSLCALSNLWVTTATADVAPKGTKCEFHISGALKSTSVASHPRGTTVSVETLFRNLPVRKQELERNIKREFARVVSFLQAYAIVCVGVKFTVYNHPPNGKKTLLFSTKANKTTKENIANVFGAKALANLIPLNLEFEMNTPASVLHRGREDTRNVKIVGHISRPVFGEGRQAPDRQLFFVNSRPCNLPQVARAINEVYKSYNLTQSPFVFADLQLDTTAYDVNVSPDKRTILLHDQASLLESLKTSLTKLFDGADQTVPAATQSKLGTFKATGAEPAKTPAKRILQRTSDDEDEGGNNDIVGAGPSKQPEIPVAVLEESNAGEEESNAAFSSLVSKLHRNSITSEPSVETERPTSSRGLTYAQKGKIAKAFAARQPSHIENNDEEETTVPAEASTKTAAEEGEEEEEEEINPHPRSQSSPKPWRRPSPQPTTITIGNRTIMSTPKRSPSKVSSSIVSSSSPTRRAAARSKKNTFAKKLKGFSAPGTQNSLTIPEDDISESEEEAVPIGIQEDNEVESPKEFEEREENVIPTLQAPRISIGTEDIEPDQEAEPEGETNPLGKNSDIVVDSEPVSTASERMILPSSPPRARRSVTGSVRNVEPVINEENGTEEQHRQRERRTVEELIAQAERPPTKPSLPKANSTIAHNIDLKDSTHCLVQNIRPLSIDKIRSLASTLRPTTTDLNSKAKGKSSKEDLLKFNPAEESSKTEERLSLTIAKSDFAKMRIAGQFNLGFILATRLSEKGDGVNDLFIIDQHASDEKYNFERLQAETVVQNQPLVRPKVLELSAMDELVVMDNMDVLKKNGFVVEIDDEGPVGKRCRLVSLPMSKDKVFDLKDFEELLHLIREHPNDDTVRPSKVRAMFAMRACRSSIMIGRTLGLKDMKKVVKHMGELDKPWNCPHGRPTMRHLCDVGQLECWGEDGERAFADDEGGGTGGTGGAHDEGEGGVEERDNEVDDEDEEWVE